ncbi:uncharacterized protein DDB_G0290685-like [Argiope bruennichi]|uniref:uncharacterized protein DDB_G0290685-like n=1 Tax=Argiope bruennichi TaxID=94029 RepID=UPI002494D7DA|nr:uncharacterized protein DDB_G0290685-like [Argiope bruennichi]
MFQTQPPAGQRRHRRLPSGTVVSYAEVKSYLSKREIPQLFESLMAGLMYHRPENHIGYLQSCLDEVKSNSETKVHWSTFVNKKRKSKEILPPLPTPKKQDSFSSSWSDNSRQSTPLPPISAKTRTRTSPDQQDLRNTYILYHNPPPILAKPKVPVISVLGGLGARIDELCEKVVGRLRGVVHISTCSMLKTRMTIEGFYRVTSVPACAVVDSVLQAMSMVQSANALLVAGFPRNRGDIEEYRSRRVRMDGVVLVDFEEEALRRFLNNEVSNGAIRLTDVETELERYKQDIISVAEYYDEKELLTVVMGDQDTEEMIEDMVIAIDKIIETRKDVSEDDSVIDSKDHNCGKESPCKALVSAPNSADRPSTVEIRDATEEDIKSIEAESRNSKRIDDEPDEMDSVNGMKEEEDQNQAKVSESGSKNDEKEKPASENSQKNSDESDKVSQNGDASQSLKSEVKSETKVVAVQETSVHESLKASENSSKTEITSQQSSEIKHLKIPIVFAFENIKTDYDALKDLIVEEMGMCYINFHELVRNDGEENDRLGAKESINLLQGVLKQDSVSYSSGFFISDFPFELLKENKFDNILKLGEVSFVCKVKEKSFEAEADEKKQPEEVLFESPMSERVRIIFVTESNVMNELKSTLQEVVVDREPRAENSIEKQSEVENNTKNGEAGHESALENGSALIDKEEKVETENSDGGDSSKKLEAPLTVDQDANGVHDNTEISQKNENEILEDGDIPASNIEMEVINQDSISEDKTSTADNEDSTCRDVDDLITDDTLNERTKPDESLKTEESKDTSLKEGVVEDLSSQINEEEKAPVEIQKEKGVLSRQQHLDIETPSVSENSVHLIKNQNNESENEVKSGADEISEVKSPLQRQGTYSSIPERSQGEVEVNAEELKVETSITGQESCETENEQEATDVEESSIKYSTSDKEIEDIKEENDEANGTTDKKEESSENAEETNKSEQNEVVVEQEDINNTAENEKDSNSETEQDVNKSNDSTNENKEGEGNSNSESEVNKNSEEEKKTDGADDEDDQEADKADGEEGNNTNGTGNGDEKEKDKEGDEEEKSIGTNDEGEKETDHADGENEKKTAQADDEEDKSSQGDNEENKSSQGDNEENKSSLGDDEENKSSQVDDEENKSSQVDDIENKSSQADDGENKISQADDGENKISQADDGENKSSQVNSEKENNTDQTDDEEKKTNQADGEEENKTDQTNVEKELESESKENSQDNAENTELGEKESDSKSNDKNADEEASETKDEKKVDDTSEKASDVKQEENSAEGEAVDNPSETKGDENSADEDAGDKVCDTKNGENGADGKDSSEENIINNETSDTEVTNNEGEENSTGNEETPTTEKEISAGGDGDNQQVSEKSEETEDKQTSENGNPEISDETKGNGEEDNDTNATKDETENKEENSSAETTVLSADDANAETNSTAKDKSIGKVETQELDDTTHQESTENTEENGSVILKSMDNDSDSNDEKSVTIETQAEVHAPDSLSPLLVQSTDDAKIEKDNVDEEERSVKDREEKNNEENSENELALENTDESQTTTENEMVITQNERFSGKLQERNGSGILGESREDDHPEAEQQERSSSSSRGEL